VLQVMRAVRVLKGREETLAQPGQQVNRVRLAPQDPEVKQDYRALKDPSVRPDQTGNQETPAHREVPDKMASLA
jgi:hypothetical protein